MDCNYKPDVDIKEVLYNMSLRQYQNFIKLRLQRGHSIFRYNIKEDSIAEAPYKEGIKKIENLTIEVGYIYVYALNVKNAMKFMDKVMFHADIISKKSKKDILLSSPGGGNEIDNKTVNNTNNADTLHD